MKRMLKHFAVATLAGVMVLSQSMSAKAEQTEKKTYVITYRAGNIGTLNTENIASIYNGAAGVKNVEVDPNGKYVKITVERGEHVPAAPSAEQMVIPTMNVTTNETAEGESSESTTSTTESTTTTTTTTTTTSTTSTSSTSTTSTSEGATSTSTTSEGATSTGSTARTSVVPEYQLEQRSGWGPSADEIVTKNKEFVVDYQLIVDAVTYQIKYVDAADGTSIAAPEIFAGNAGTTVDATAPLSISVSGATTYNLADDQTKSVTLSKEEGAANVIEFKYSVAPRYVGEEEVVTTLPGTTVTTIETIQGAGGAVAGNVAVAGGAGAGGNAAVAGDANAAGNEATPEVNIADEDTALASTVPGEEPVTIEEEDTALADSLSEGNNAIAFAFAAACVLGAGAAGVFYFLNKKKLHKMDTNHDRTEE